MSTFQQAAAFANSQRGKKSLSNDQLLQLYAHFKQGSGPNTTPKPSVLDFKGTAKWNAWKALGAMPAATAQAKYVELVNKWLR